jgi:mono/diheme cytochrome c family protein
LLTLLALLTGAPAAAQAQEEGVPGDPRVGQTAAKRLCAECHRIEAGEPTPPGVDAPSFQDVARTQGMAPIALYVWLHSPHPTMPHIRLEPEEAEDVVAYIWSLRNSQ